ncbi:mediator complex subunit MED14-domain-containing protein [Microdochium bolleyi]|uniref:Mediator of RNA polymerase II transcription subunit 14 n=1 Tax=Microdochium bolleyi TaxID=196109 RepID=A0A136J2Y2_9PEZI|nr:mediator complex subunit MED14-domain-containing protein [Microdochium bolleyi]
MPLPSGAPIVNGNAVNGNSLPDDSSPENIRKKAHLLEFVKDEHAKWVKALVMTSWSRKAETVSKLIDLYNAINMQKVDYLRSVEHLIDVRTALPAARLGEPDLQTALQILSTGEATWMPDLQYIDPPPISTKEKLQWIENTNTLLSLRLNLEEHDKIPVQFKEYKIESGRVTFVVPGEFEVDLTIADEDFEKQFWFIDFRFSFTPAPAELSDLLRQYLEVKVNETLEKDGLGGCYKFLHEFVLTHKITEFVRQAFELSRHKWVDTLKVERLNRAMSIQYWANRQPSEGPKSWILLGVHSGKLPGKPFDPSATSRLTLRWFKDNKEVLDAQIPLDDSNISTERLLKRVIGRHVKSTLGAIYTRLNGKGRFQSREAALALSIMEDDPVMSSLQMQIGRRDVVTVKIAPTTGQFAISPQTAVTYKGENRLNVSSKDHTDEGVTTLESIRCYYTVDELNRRGKSMGWNVCRAPVKMDDVKPILNTRESFQAMWFKRRGWPEQWYLMLSLSLGGDRWWLVEIASGPPRISSYTPLSLTAGLPELSDKFFHELTVFTAAMIAQITDLRRFQSLKIDHATEPRVNKALPPGVRVPAIKVKLSDILQRPGLKAGRGPSWALDSVRIMFLGIRNSAQVQPVVKDENNSGVAMEKLGNNEHKLTTLVDARFKVADPERFSMLNCNVERDVVFNKQLGVFALHLQTELGTPIFDTLKRRLQAIERLFDCVDAIRRCDRDVRCENISLQKIVFSYSQFSKLEAEAPRAAPIRRWMATLDLSTDDIQLRLEDNDPQLRLIDAYHKFLNSELRFERLPYFLSITSPLQSALDAIEAAWVGLAADNKGRVELYANYLDCFSIHYILPGADKGSERRAVLRVKLKERKNNLYWWVYRDEPGPDKNPDDAFKKALEPVWGAAGREWRNLGSGAACPLGVGVETLLKAVDEAIRPLALQSPKAIRQSISNASGGGTKNQKPSAVIAQGKVQQTSNISNNAKARPQLQQQKQQVGEVVVLD